MAWIAPNNPVPAAMAASRMTPTRVTPGAICLSSSSHLPLRPYSNEVKPVTLPPGRARLSTKPAPTASTSCRIRSNACDTLTRFCARHVLCWCVFPLAPALRSTDTAATTPADASAVGFLRFVRRLHRYYDEVRLLVSVHHRLWLLAFPMRTIPLTQHLTARHEISQVPMRSLCT